MESTPKSTVFNKLTTSLENCTSASSPPQKPAQEINSIYGGVASVAEPPQIAPPATTAQIKTTKTNNWSPSLQTLLDQPPATLPQRLILGGMVFCVAFTAWTWFGTIEEVGKAQGKLVPKGKTYQVEPIDTGKAIAVAVEEGEAVEAGQVLVELDNELTQKEIERLQQMLAAYETELEQKQDLLAGVNLEAQTRAVIAAAETLAQRTAIASAEEKAATTRQLLAQMNSEAAAYRTKQSGLEPLAAMAQKQREQLELETVAHQQRLDRLLPLTQAGAVSQEFVFQAEQDLRNTQQRITQNKIQEITNTKEPLFAVGQSLREIEARTTQSQGELASVLKEIEQLRAQLTQKQAEESRIKLEAQQKIQQLEVEITQLEAKIAETQNLLLSAKAKLKHTFLKAPVDGTVLSLDLQNTGEVVQSGQTVAEIAPYNVPLVLSAVLSNREAGFVKKGMPVKVKFDAYPYQDYGVVPGEVFSISADAESDERLGEVYRVDIVLERDYIATKKQQIEFKAGQTASADIVIRRRRIVDVLLDPFKKLQEGGIDL